MHARPRFLLLLLAAAVSGAGEEPSPLIARPAGAQPDDPALQLTAPKLAEGEIRECRELFKQLASEEFDTREQALSRLVSKGPAVLALAAEYAASPDAETAALAKSLNQRILLNYDGYLPADPKIEAALNKKVEWQSTHHTPIEVLVDYARQAGLNMVVDSSVGVPTRRLGFSKGMTLRDFFTVWAPTMGLAGTARGDVFLVTTPQAASRLATQRRIFDWTELRLNRDEAERVGLALHAFVPNGTEIHTGSDAVSMRGEEGCIPRAARLFALLKPGSPDALYSPGPPRPGAPRPARLNTAELAARLATPVSVSLEKEEPLNILRKLKKLGYDVFLVHGEGAAVAVQDRPFPPEAAGAAPLRLTLQDLPLGLVLRWVQRRTRFVAGAQSDATLAYEIGSAPAAGRLQFQVQSRNLPVLQQHLAGADVSFLYPRGSKPSAESDAAARMELLAALDAHLALFPAFRPADVVVLRGRLLMQGPSATLSRALDLLRQWRETGTPPPPAAWKSELDARLSTRLDWDGQGLSGGKVLRQIRTLGKINLLLEDSPDGSPPSFQLTAQDSELLPPGKHALKQLLDDLAQKANAQWSAELGAIVLTPKPEK